MTAQSHGHGPPTSYLEALRGIDMARLRRLADEPPGDPTRTVRSMVTASSAVAGFNDLMVWEQSAQAQEYYIPPNHSYDVFIRLAAASPVVQWREGCLDIRHNAAGQIVVVPPYRAVYFRTFGPGHNIHLSLAPGVLMRAAGHDRPKAGVSLKTCFGERDEVIAGMGCALLEYVKAPGGSSRAFMEAASVALAVRLLERFGTDDKIPRRTLTPAQLARIDDYLAAQVDRPTSLRDLAQIVDLSPQVFHRAFKAATGLPPLRYCQQLRMRRARDLVEGTATPIGEIAGAVGFCDLAHFTNTFRKHWGVAPTRLRRG
jgi:AraC-like DNA-binding protein